MFKRMDFSQVYALCGFFQRRNFASNVAKLSHKVLAVVQKFSTSHLLTAEGIIEAAKNYDGSARQAEEEYLEGANWLKPKKSKRRSWLT